jgi:hypothetical protein
MKSVRIRFFAAVVVAALLVFGILAMRYSRPPIILEDIKQLSSSEVQVDEVVRDQEWEDREDELRCVIDLRFAEVDTVEFHLNKQLIAAHQVFLSQLRDNTPENKGVIYPQMAHRLCRIPGVIDVTISELYEVRVKKGKAYGWQKIVNAVMNTFSEELNGGKSLTIRRAPAKNTQSKRLPQKMYF